MLLKKRLRFRDLKERGIVKNRPSLKNLQETRGFPKGKMTGANTRTWTEDEVCEWVEIQPEDPKPAHPAKRPRGRPRKLAASEHLPT